jgi:hypothetical protein
VSWLNPYSWTPDRPDTVGLRLSGVFRWIMIAICIAAVGGFAIGLVVGVRNDLALARNGVPVTATIVDKAAYDGHEDQYLLNYTVNNQLQYEWVTGLSKVRVNDQVAVVVDRTDPQRVAVRPVDTSSWIANGVWFVGAVFFGWLGYGFIRMDATGFRRYTFARFGRV